MFTYTLDPMMLWENGFGPNAVSGPPAYNVVGAGSRWSFTTTADYMEVDAYTTQTLSTYQDAPNSVLGYNVTSGGVLRPLFGSAPPLGASTVRCTLLNQALKTVDLFTPGQHATSAGGAAFGCYLITLRTNQPVTFIAPPTPAKRLCILGDSIGVGAAAISQSNFGYAGLMKRGAGFGGYNGSVTLWRSWGTKRQIDDWNGASACAASAALIAAQNFTDVMPALGTNDQAVIPNVPLATFATNYALMLDAIHAAQPSLRVWCLSPFLRGNPEVANGNGNTMDQFRSAISTAVSTRTAFATYIEGKTILAQPADFELIDNVHPTTAGHLKAATALLAVLP